MAAMASPSPEPPGGAGDLVVAPPPEPQAIRACLSVPVAAEFDAEWATALEAAKQSHDLAGVDALLAKWRHLAFAERSDPGSYFRVLATATHTLATGHPPPGTSTSEDIRALLAARRDRR